MSAHIDKNGKCINDALIAIANGNTKCNLVGSRGGAGGYISGIIKLSHRITAFATIGGQGIYGITSTFSTYDCDKMVKGGYGGRGYASNFFDSYSNYGSGSGGGQTAVKFLSNDLWHRVIVAGAGGGSDNIYSYGNTDDGSGGSGGDFTAQGFWVDGVLNSEKIANSTFGFTFGAGESAQQNGSKNPNGVQEARGASDKVGAGSGWFGGFSSHNGDGGSGGGSSWALSANAVIPQGNIDAKGSFFEENESHPYSFSLDDGYIFSDVKTYPGIWKGNGRLVITILDSIIYPSCVSINRSHFSYFLLFILFFETHS
ncbi:PE_PGRS protein, putative [Trichomonas vaginalis G3]|uniref:receptor protein-tyrosine kinase n=1 Tax=Trichomonas vaginalis (strain ATCC PRA-98 / G3) TaxID=412133 RepID=A2G2H2_TRIV3|nr:glycine-rich protein family [Trichomonas vaginalis G3]EAX88651.1 PE_PGRS protein, putative [Trichomonas vaginalis G3]KAI5517199.1 glycine-rich protein family [Trichomonas vaginalis G3]|eukprot:XP_001301581.1 PE_PGRS protein [Trichomonas vaginalis G3]